MKLHILVQLVVCMFFINILHAEQDSTQKQLLQTLQALSAFQSDFRQELFDEKGKIIQKAQGRFYFDGKKQFNNTLEKPEHVILVSDGKKLWQIDFDLEQVSIGKLSNYLSGSPLALLLEGDANALKPFEINAQYNSELKQHHYYLKAREEYATIQNIHLSFVSGKLDYIELKELSGKQLRLNFPNQKALESTQVFKAVYPKHFAVIDESGV